MKVRELMTPWPMTVGPGYSLAEAVEEMLRLEVRGLPVVEDDTLVGMITDRDVRAALGPKARHLELATLEGDALKDRVRDWMTPDVSALGAEDDLAEAARALAEARVGAMPVVDEDGVVVGILSTTDVLFAAADVLEGL